MKLSSKILDKLETPCVVIDEQQVQKNIEKMQLHTNQYGCQLRPHIKTHKMKHFAKMQIQAGAKGISCAKVSEAEVMAEAGIDDIFIAYPLVGKLRIERALKLHKKVKRLILAVDSYSQAEMLNQICNVENLSVEIRLEVDTGAKRTGVKDSKIVDLVKKIKTLSHLRLTGIYTFKSMVYQNHPTLDSKIAGIEEGSKMEAIRQTLLNEGLGLFEMSAGSTPTAYSVSETKKVDEIRPGTYIFNDYMLYKEGITSLDEVAAYIYARVVHVDDNYLIVDGGSKAFSTDITLQSEPYFYKGYAYCREKDCYLSKANEEHGFVFIENADKKFVVGEILQFIPVHVCTTINLHNDVYIYDGKDIRLQKVDARGMVK